MRAWWEGERLFLRVPPRLVSGQILALPDLEVRDLARGPAGAVYLGLSTEPFDPDDEEPTRHLVRLVGPRELLVPAAEEGETALELLRRASIEALLERPEHRRARLDEALGSPPTAGSTEWYRDCFQERLLERPFKVLDRALPDGTILEVAQVQAGEPLVVLLSALGREEEFEVADFLEERFLVLTSRQRTFVGVRPPAHVACLGTAMATASADEVERAGRGWVDRLEEGRRGRRIRFRRPLDPEVADRLAQRLRDLARRAPKPGPVVLPPPPPPPLPPRKPRKPRRKAPAPAGPEAWIGRRLGRYRLERVLGQGFAWTVFEGLHEDGFSRAALKVARPAAEEGTGEATVAGRRTGPGWASFLPEPSFVVATQGSRLLAVRDPALVLVEELVVREDLCYFAMELLEGRTLRAMVREGAVPVGVLLRVARALERLTQHPSFPYHGDLKPENVLVTPGGIRLLDPGWFEGDRFVTTPWYYPRLVPDDLLAMGILLWEAACGSRPFPVPQPSPLDLHLASPPEGLPVPVRDLLEQATGLPVPTGESWDGGAFSDWSHLAAALEGLLDAQILEIGPGVCY